MNNSKPSLGGFQSRIFGAGLMVAALGATGARAWDYEGHRIVNELALASLATESGATGMAGGTRFPDFVRTPANAERIAFLAGEPDRWRNVPDLALKQANSLDHYLDSEELGYAGLDPARVSPLRYEFALQFAAGRAAHLDRFPTIDPAKNQDHTLEWCGFLPWAISEYYSKLRSDFNSLRTFEAYGGTPEEIANAQADIVTVMGIMGHFVGDGSQPLHSTVHHHGWVGPNPEGYTRWYGIHALIDGGFIAAAGISVKENLPQVTPAEPLPTAPRSDGREPVFAAVMDYLLAQQREVIPLYELHKAGKFSARASAGDAESSAEAESGEAPEGAPARRGRGRPSEVARPSPEGRAFIDAQLLKGGQMLGALWLTAWQHSAPDPFLRSQLARRAPANP